MQPIYFDENPDILSMIYNVDPRVDYRQLSKQLYNQTGLSFYEKNCDKPLTLTEIRNYITTKPDSFGMIHKVVELDGDPIVIIFCNVIYQCKMSDGYINEDIVFDIYHGRYNAFTENYIRSSSIEMDKLLTNIKDGTYDLYTLYQVYKNRTNCMKVNKNYAKEKIMKEFIKETKLDDSFLNTYIVYIYLCMNCYVFGEKMKYREIKRLKYNPEYIRPRNDKEILDYIYGLLERPLQPELYEIEKNKMLEQINIMYNIVVNHIENL